jgi:hypothetical protein
VLEAFSEEQRAPTLAVVASKLKVVAMSRHAGNDVTDTASVVKAAMKAAQFWFARFEGEEAKSRREVTSRFR